MTYQITPGVIIDQPDYNGRRWEVISLHDDYANEPAARQRWLLRVIAIGQYDSRAVGDEATASADWIWRQRRYVEPVVDPPCGKGIQTVIMHHPGADAEVTVFDDSTTMITYVEMHLVGDPDSRADWYGWRVEPDDEGAIPDMKVRWNADKEALVWAE